MQILTPFAIILSLVAADPFGRTIPLRELSTDRPDRTESPYSVPKGWLQFESDVLSRGRLAEGSGTVTSTTALTLNLKYGLTQRMDVQFVITPWERVETEAPNIKTTETVSGEAGVRLKYNITGNDSPGTALAVLPFVLVPIEGENQTDRVTWGAVAPVAVPLGDRTFSVMPGFSRVENDEFWLIGSVSLGSPVVGDVAGFIEMYVSRAGFEEDAPDDTTLDAGLTYAPDPDWQLDLGVYIGMTDNSEDWRVFAGASGRFLLRGR